jgi:hypothetical protein
MVYIVRSCFVKLFTAGSVIYTFEEPDEQNCTQKTWLDFQNVVYYLSRSREGNSQHMIPSGMKFSSMIFFCTCGEMNENEDELAVRLYCISKVAFRVSVGLQNILNNRNLLVLNITL